MSKQIVLPGTRLRAALILVTITVALVLSLAASGASVAQEPACRLYIAPVESTAVVGQEIELAVQVEGVNDLYGFDLELGFDADLFEAVDANPGAEGVQLALGPFLSGNSGTGVFLLSAEADNDSGATSVVLTLLYPRPPMQGNHTLFYLTLRALSQGSGDIEFLRADLSTPWGGRIMCSGEKASIDVVPDAPEPTCYALTLGHTGQGSDPVATPTGSTGCPVGEYVAGEVIALSGATPAAGWEIAGWTGTGDDGSTANTNSLTMPAADHASGVTYVESAPVCYALTLSHDGQGSDPVATPTNSTGCEEGEYLVGESITLTAAPAGGWHIGGWSGTDNDSSTATTNGLTMPAQAHVVSVTYVESAPVCYALTLGHSGQGSDPVADPTSSTGCAPGEYVAGEVIALSGAAPAAGWEIAGWTGTGDDGSTAAANSLIMPAADHAASVIYASVPLGMEEFRLLVPLVRSGQRAP